jgi:hypothetical protein
MYMVQTNVRSRLTEILTVADNMSSSIALYPFNGLWTRCGCDDVLDSKDLRDKRPLSLTFPLDEILININLSKLSSDRAHTASSIYNHNRLLLLRRLSRPQPKVSLEHLPRRQRNKGVRRRLCPVQALRLRADQT